MSGLLVGAEKSMSRRGRHESVKEVNSLPAGGSRDLAAQMMSQHALEHVERVLQRIQLVFELRFFESFNCALTL